MRKIIGRIHKSYFIDTLNIKNNLIELIGNNSYLEGKIFSNRIYLTSKEMYKFNIYEYPIYNIKGDIISKNNGYEIHFKVGTYWGEEIIALGMIAFSIIFGGVSLCHYYYPFLSRKGDFFEIGLIIVFLVGIWRLYIVYNRKQKGVKDIEKLIAELKKIN